MLIMCSFLHEWAFTFIPFFILTHNATVNIFMSALCIPVIYRASRSVIVAFTGICIKKIKKKFCQITFSRGYAYIATKSLEWISSQHLTCLPLAI